MNIWIINQFAATPQLPGSKRSYQYAKAFADMGNNVTLWMSSFGHWGKVETIQDNLPFSVQNQGRLKLISLKTKPTYSRNDSKRFLNMIHFAYTFSKISRNMQPLPDVIIACYPSPFAAFAAYRSAARYNARFVLEVRDLWPQNWVERKAFSRHHPFVLMLYAMEKYLYKNSNVFVSALPYVSDYLIERQIKRKEIFWIPNAADMTEVESDKNETAEGDDSNNICDVMKLHRQRGTMNVVYVGGLGQANRVDKILEAARILRDKGENGIFFSVVGEGHSREKLLDFVKQNNLESVKIWPAVPGKAVPKILRCGDVGVLCLHDNPIYKYGVNLHKIYDYMSVSLPIVFAARVRNDLVASSHAGFTVSPDNAAEIADALVRFKSMNEEERKEIGKRGNKFLAENYDINILSKKYLEIIS